MSRSVVWRETVEELAARCVPAGLDLVCPLPVKWYNDVVEEEFRLPNFDRPQALAVLIGNTRALWPRFLDAFRSQSELLDDKNPLDSYVVEVVHRALHPLRDRWEVRWAHKPAPQHVAMQRLAHVSGLTYLSPSHLNVHPVYGPWIALRAVVVVDIDGPSGSPPEPVNPCNDCEANCLAMFEQAIAAAGPSLTHGVIGDQWRVWLAVRDACPIGRAYRYGDEQIRYHYAKDRQVLQRAVAGSGTNIT